MNTPAYTGLRVHTSTPSRNAHPIVPETSLAGSTVTPATPQAAARDARREKEPVGPTREQHREREAGEVDEAVSGRDECGQVVQPVRVEAPDERADDLADGRDDDDRERLDAYPARMERKERHEHAHGEDPEQELTAMADVLVDDEAAERPRGDGEERHEGEAPAHHAHLRRSGGCGSIEG